MSNSFVPTVLGLTAFMASNRVDFVLEGPDCKDRVSAFYGKPASLKLSGKNLKIVSFDKDDNGTPSRLTVKYGRDTIVLGRRKNASGPVSFYRQLTPQNQNAPQNPEDVCSALESLIA